MYFTQNATLGLASKSPRRIQLLTLLGVNFEIITNNNIELKPNQNELPKPYSIRTSNDKLKKIDADNKEFIIASDTIIAFQNQIFGKPKDKKDAFKMLSKLSNNLHEVITTISILNTNTGEIKYNTQITKVYFKNWNQKNIKNYINNFDIKDKAGAYAIQDGTNSPVKKINGCTLNVIGLPVCNLIELLIHFKIIKFDKKIKKSELCEIINIWQEREGSNP
tara:strand:- start:15 stop:677 length:663 start_codon:yes stop_codon:yes gene_type:complete